MARKKQQPIIEKENKDGFISGGYIYDQLDRFAQILALSISNHKYEFTQYGFIKYLKQLCVDDFYIGYNWKFKIGRRYFIKVYAKDRNGVKIASAIFCFIGTEKNYCNLKNKTYN